MRIIAFTRDHRAKLGLEADVQDRGEGVGEVENQSGAGDAGNTIEIGHCSADEECQCSVDGAESAPQVFTTLVADLGELEISLENLNVGCHYV